MSGPLTAYQALRDARGPCALLESTSPAGPCSRLSLLAREPQAVLIGDRDGLDVFNARGRRRIHGDPVAGLRAVLRDMPPGRWPEEGGIVGALAYDYARPRRPPAATPLLLGLAVDRFEAFEAAGPAPVAPTPVSGPSLHLSAASSLTRDDHRRLVQRIQEHIAAGDVYQVNLSQRFRLPWLGDGLALYHHLRGISPVPFAGYLRAGDVEIVSASPERLLLVEEGRAATRPIAGTRPRAADPLHDQALARELILSEKERAEHLMLVDLARNDLGRVAEIGSVRVDELMTVEEYAQVRHIASNVTARLAPGHDALDALLALFPGGTITGVPKIRCMDILDALEPVPRGFYTGSLFYLTPSGRLDANILIRSAVVHGGSLTFHTGGGIVADSDPDLEYQETLHKAEGMKQAVEAVLAAV